MTEVNRRQFLKITGATLAGSKPGAHGILANRGRRRGSASSNFCALRKRVTRVRTARFACGIVMYGLGRWGRRTPSPPSSTSRAIRIIRSIAAPCVRKARACSISCTARAGLQRPEYRAPGSDKWVPISWDDAPQSHCEAPEGRSRCQLHHEECAGWNGQPLVDDGHAGGVCEVAMRSVTSRRKSFAAWGMFAFRQSGACV